MIERANYNNHVKTYTTKTESHTRSGSTFSGQGGDFVLEEVNRTIKSFLPPSGLPSKKTWVNIIRKAKILQSMKSSLLNQTEIVNENGRKRPKKFDHEITMVRRRIRDERK